MSRLIPTTWLVAALLAAHAVDASPADAVAFPVRTCNSADVAENRAWTAVATASSAQIEIATRCPSGAPDPYGTLLNGLAVVDVIKVLGAAPDAAYAEWRFTAPTGTKLVGASVTRDIGNRDEWTPYGRIDGRDQRGESCVPGMGEAYCRIQGTRVFSGLDATTIAYGVRCVTAPYCAHGATLRTVWVLVLGATVTLDDRQAPAVSALDVAGVGGGSWWGRAGSVSFSAQDNTGVRRRRVVVDSVSRVVVDAPGAAAGGCGDLGRGVAYSYSRPCADARGLNGMRALAVSPCGWGDGAHAVRGVAVDTGGLETSTAAATVRVDCTAPAVTFGAAPGEVVEGDLVEPPPLEAVDATSGLGQTAIELSVDGGPWLQPTTPPVAEAGRSYAFRARAVDVAGNWSGWRTAAAVLGVARAEADPEPEPEPAPQAGAGPQGSDQPAGTGDEAPPAPGPPPAAVALPEPLATLRRPDAPAGLADARLRVERVRVGRRRVIVRGTAASALTTIGTVSLSTPRRTRSKRIAIADGRWRATFAASRRRPTRVAITTPPTATHAAATAAWRPKRPRRGTHPLR